MKNYTCVLCAVDLSHENAQVVQGALRAVLGKPEQVHLIHACEHPITGYGEAMGSNHRVSEQQIKQGVYPTLETLARQHHIPCEQIHIAFGRPATVIHTVAQNLGADLIVVGSHGKHGIQLLLGSTANTVVHGSQCDVLTIRIK